MTASRDSWWIDLQGELALRIPTASLRYFEQERLRNLQGREVEVGGWLVYRGQSSKRRAFMMHVYHPASMEILEPEPGYSDLRLEPLKTDPE